MHVNIINNEYTTQKKQGIREAMCRIDTDTYIMTECLIKASNVN